MSPVELAEATIDAIASRVAELLRAHPIEPREPDALIDAGELARRTGVSRTWIYQHARELGAIRLGGGPNARLRFDPSTIDFALAAQQQPAKQQAPKARPRRSASAADVPLLPIKDSSPPMSRFYFVRRRSH
jgi:predicted DNA-binding transcriptional regulator AlpA